MLAELQNLNRYLGSMIPLSSQAESDSDTGRVMTRLAESGLIRPIRVVSGSEMCSLPSMPVMKLKLPVSVFYRQYNLWGRSSDHKLGGSTRRGNKTQSLDRFRPLGRG